MGAAYLFALVAALGVLLVQVLAGSAKGGGGHDADAGEVELEHHAGPGHEAGASGHDLHGHDLHDAGAHGPGAHADHGAGEAVIDAGVLSLFASTRFWIFASLGFGLSGSLLHFLSLAGRVATPAIAVAAGLASGLFAALALRALQRSSVTTSGHASDAVGRVGRVLVDCAPGRKGKIRIDIGGQSVDLLATASDERLARGEAVLVEDVDAEEGVARIVRRPAELE